ncbi:ChbG/HpnK family deacetylase [Inquilinus sp. KBS0705]|nr:ChbG/HpnK family deacetylase [Inquilinus sp. KBS0705]
MLLNKNVIATADDFGLSSSVNRAILKCFDLSVINSTSFLTNTILFEESVNTLHQNPVIQNVGVHVNFTEGKPVSNFKLKKYLDSEGNWDSLKTTKVLSILNAEAKTAFTAEIDAQINKALSHNVTITHFDSHNHVHTLPQFQGVFFNAAKKHNLKLRLAQSYKENSYIKYTYRKYINNKLIANDLNYSDRFETVGYYLNNAHVNNVVTEIMLHPDLDTNGNLTDHFEGSVLTEWINYIKKENVANIQEKVNYYR